MIETFRRLRLALLLILALGAAAPGLGQEPEGREPEPAATGSAGGTRILVGPDLLASRDGDFPHLEPMVAAHPRDPRHLVAGAITFPRPDRDAGCKVYVSRDGGFGWKGVELEEQIEHGLGDPQVVFTPRGTLIFACLARVPDEAGRTRSALHVYRSEDGGLTWDGPVELADRSYDHPQIAVDATTGRYAGHIYIGVLYGGREYTLGVFRSEDDGRSFIGPVELAHREGYGSEQAQGINVTGLGVLSDGTLVASYTDFPLAPEVRAEPHETTAWMVASEDGGLTFSAPRKVAAHVSSASDGSLASRLGGFAVWAVDGSDGATRDRLYHAWSDWASGVSRVKVTASADRGETWSEPREVDPGAPPEVHQFLPALAVDGEGTLGVAFFDTRGFPDADGYHQRFTASVDGGASFLDSKPLSSRPSRPQGVALNQRPVLLTVSGGGDDLMLTFVSALGRWPSGGDFMGLAVDARGVFHPLWADARDGAFQLWTATVRVEREEESGAVKKAPGATETPAEPRRINARVELVSDPATWDPESREMRVPVRLRNVSDQPIRRPLEVEVVELGFGREIPPEMEEFWRQRMPAILNADNGESTAGAVFDYSGTLGDLEALEPGAVTGARVWRIRRPKDAMPPIRLEIRGTVPER